MAKLPAIDPEFIVICQSAWCNDSGIDINYDWDGERFNNRMFCKWLRDKHGIDTDALPTYWHMYEDGRRVQAKAYPESLLAEWRKHFREEWLPNRAVEYFKGRDSLALQYLPRLLPKPRAA